MEITHIGGPTAVLNLGGLTFLIDPAFDEPRDYQLPGRVMTKLIGPAIPAEKLGPIDVALVSHDEHKDNLDDAGRALPATIPTVLSTPGAATRIEGVRGLENWESVDLPRPDGGVIRVHPNRTMSGVLPIGKLHARHPSQQEGGNERW